MCSWCWGYRPTWLQLRSELPAKVRVINVLGGLAPDSDQPMPLELRQTIRGHWSQIRELLGTEFNFDFWTRCRPRRDTYKACRAVVAAAGQGAEEEMIEAIQRCYYLRAMNPSEPDTLVQIAGEIGLDTERFARDLFAAETEVEFQRQLTLRRRLGIRSFPSLVLQATGHTMPLTLDYRDYRIPLREILSYP